MKKKTLGSLFIVLCLLPSGCSAKTDQTDTETQAQEADTAVQTSEDQLIQKEDITIGETIENSEDEAHAIEADGIQASYSNTLVVKTGEASGDEADFYGVNAAVFATNGATLDLDHMIITTDGTHANAVFSYGEGTTVNIADSVIETSGNCSGGIMTTGGGTMNASGLNIHTTGNSSAAIRSDRGGGTVTVDGGSYVTDGVGSPVIYSTANITVNNAYLESTSSQGVVVEGQNSVTLNDAKLVADNTSKNSDKSDWYQAVMIYQSMSGDADEGLASFTMNGGSLTNRNGDIFFVNNTIASISLKEAAITNEDEDGVFLRAAAAGWGSSGSNGGHVTLNCSKQEINGDVLVNEVSLLNMYLKDGSVFTGSIENEGDVYVEIEAGSKWVLSADSHVSSLTCSADGIDLNGHKLYVDGEEYKQGQAMDGEAITVAIESSGHGQGRPEMPQGEGPGQGTPPEKPDGEKPSRRPDHNG